VLSYRFLEFAILRHCQSGTPEYNGELTNVEIETMANNPNQGGQQSQNPNQKPDQQGQNPNQKPGQQTQNPGQGGKAK
jgi:hypothetical protein